MNSIIWILIGILILGPALYLHRKYYLLQYLFFLRYPLLLALVLLMLPLTAVEAVGAPFRNLFIHERPSGLALVTTLALLVSWQTMYLVGFLFEHIPQRVKLRFHRRQPDGAPMTNVMPQWLVIKWLRFPAFALLAIPIVATSAWHSFKGRVENGGEITGLDDIAIGIGMGIVLPVLLVVLLTQAIKVRERLAGWAIVHWLITRALSALPQALVRLTAWIDKHLFGSTTIDTDQGARASHPRVFRIDIVSYFAALTLLFYILIGAFPPEPGHNFVTYDLPAMIYVLLLIMVIGWILPWLSFLLDRHRVLPEIPVVLLIVIFYNVFRTDHYFNVVYADDACPKQEDAGERLSPGNQALARNAWTGNGTTRPVIVAASGGGISAAYWTAIVLSEIEADLRFDGDPGAGFSDSIYMVSGTSGGSVGLLYYVDAFSEKRTGARQFTAQELAWIREAAGASSLNAVGWGLVFRDFWRLVFPPLAAIEEDRATAMEARWVQGLLANRKRWAASEQGTSAVHNPTIGDWINGARQGWQPAVAFNSVLVETGELFQIANVNLPPLRKDTETTRDTEHQFHDLFPGADIGAVTAARLSATFPWVTPSARPDLPDRCENLYHAADGGYYDNYGVISALAYNKALQGTTHKPVLIEIRSSDSRLRAEPEIDGGFGMVALGPIQALLSVRNTSQLGRNEGLAETAFADRDRIIFELRKKAPLSWHLAPRERADIAAEWREPHNQEAFEKLCKALKARCGLQ